MMQGISGEFEFDRAIKERTSSLRGAEAAKQSQGKMALPAAGRHALWARNGNFSCDCE
jgi:hypothetical protein